MPTSNRWSHEELLLTFILYCKTPFGQFHRNNPNIIELADYIGRTPSAVAMKLGNYASLDPFHQQRGIKGLGNVSKADKEAWDEFTANWNKYAEEGETLFERIHAQANSLNAEESIKELSKVNLASTEAQYFTTVRLGQRFFRTTILANYRKCCICGIPITSLLIASHIIPWSDREDLRLNPCNGLCLCAIHDKAFDEGLITVNTEYRVIVGGAIKDSLPQEALAANFVKFENRLISLPDKFLPDRGFLSFHNQAYFLG